MLMVDKKIMWLCEHHDITKVSGICPYCHRKEIKQIYDTLLGLIHQYDDENYSTKQIVKRVTRWASKGKRKLGDNDGK